MDVEFLGGRRKNASAVSTSLPKRLFLSGRNGRRSKPGSWTRAWCLVCESLRAAAVPVLVLRRPDVLHARREHHRRTEDSAASAGQRCGQRFVVGVRTTARRFFVFRRSLEQKQAPCVSRRRKKTAPVDRKLNNLEKLQRQAKSAVRRSNLAASVVGNHNDKRFITAVVPSSQSGGKLPPRG